MALASSDYTITLTFGEVAENHVSMEQLGTKADHGYSVKDLQHIYLQLSKDGYNCELVNLNNALDEPMRSQIRCFDVSSLSVGQKISSCWANGQVDVKPRRSVCDERKGDGSRLEKEQHFDLETLCWSSTVHSALSSQRSVFFQ